VLEVWLVIVCGAHVAVWPWDQLPLCTRPCEVTEGEVELPVFAEVLESRVFKILWPHLEVVLGDVTTEIGRLVFCALFQTPLMVESTPTRGCVFRPVTLVHVQNSREIKIPEAHPRSMIIKITLGIDVL
jgi:hypothetical protein